MTLRIELLSQIKLFSHVLKVGDVDFQNILQETVWSSLTRLDLASYRKSLKKYQKMCFYDQKV